MTNSETKVDVRIIISGPDLAEIVSKAIKQLNLENDYNLIVSSIIPTQDIAIAQKVASGGDIIIIGGYGLDEDYNLLYNELKNDFNHIGLFDYNNIFAENGSIDFDLAQCEIFNSIIRSGLSYSLNIVEIHSLENKYHELYEEYNKLKSTFNKLTEEYNSLSLENRDNLETIKTLNNTISNLKKDFVKYEDIKNKNVLELFNLKELWFEVFHDYDFDEDKIIEASNNFKPESVVVGQGFICALDKSSAIEWLKIIKTALIFIKDSEEESSDFNSIDEFWEN